MTKTFILLTLMLSLIGRRSALATSKPAVADNYLDLTTTYCIYAKALWHECAVPDVGGYWGDGLAPTPDKNGNGNVRGMSSTMLGYAMLIHAMDEGWLDPKLASQLQQAGLSRDELLHYIELNLRFLNAHHLSNTTGPTPKWGFSWQSTLWLGSSGPAALMVWKDLPDDVKTDFKRVAGTEADRIVAKPPKDYKPGDTGAEENAWDEYAPAVALAIDPTNPHAGDWMKALKSYAMNVYSIHADKGQEFVSTANLFDDFTLENHGFFHPDYVQVSGQDLGTSLVVLQMGDKLNGTHLADEFKPCAMHHLKDVWEHVMRNLLLDDGQFAFPNGTDWTIHTSMEPGYLACIATLLNDPIALAAEAKHANNALRHREASPTGRIFGDTNMEWWWEPLLVQRFASAMLQHEYRDGVPAAPIEPDVNSRRDAASGRKGLSLSQPGLFRLACMGRAAYGDVLSQLADRHDHPADREHSPQRRRFDRRAQIDRQCPRCNTAREERQVCLLRLSPKLRPVAQCLPLTSAGDRERQIQHRQTACLWRIG